MHAHTLTSGSFGPNSITTRSVIAAVMAASGLALVALGSALPWVVLFRGLQPEPGFLLDGGKLAGVAVASAVALLVSSRIGGSTVLRLAALAGAAVVVGDSLLVHAHIAAYVADPGPAGPLTQPSSGPGAVVMAVGGVLLLAAAGIAPLAGRPLPSGMRLRLGLASALFVAGWIHLLLTPEHLGESAILGTGFLVAGITQVVLAGLVIARPHDWVGYAVVAVNVSLIAIYANAVLIGLPFGGDDHEAAGLVIGAGEPVDVFGAMTTVAQVIGVALAVAGLGRAAEAVGNERA
ncbi:MAG: hypothetical protein QOF49_849 [Chloroflexota bacterium]|jgi:hypothetical protein|nr:hypothetical protein [Chloroflexota bacterium]